jgi:thioredoxin reductase/Pyruvate/2-oxoacid:ferredoxin oxidoreductase delta subunit
MEMLVTTLGFFAISALAVWAHLRREARGAGRTAAAPLSGPPCPRCAAPVASGSAFCPSCGVPQQIFEVVSAPEARPPAADGPEAAPLRAVVRADMCVGCGGCVAACPEQGAIALVGKLAVVDAARCRGHGECAAACPVGAISMTRGEASNRVEVPEVGPNFETNVPGLYIVGELGGRGLIKNAVNEGKIAIEHVRRMLPPGEARLDGDAEAVDVAIVGSGPAGLSAGLEALRSGLSYLVLEQGNLADTVRKYPRHKLLLAEPVSIPLYGDLWVADASKESLLQVWETIVANTGLQVRTGQRVEGVTRDGAVFRVRTAEREFRARRVVLAMGRRGTPRTLGVAGEELSKVLYDIVEMEAFRGRRVLVVGGGDSAVESALGLANQPATAVTLSYRGDRFARIKERNREKLERALADGRVAALLRSQVREVRADVVVLDVDGAPRILPNDDVVVRIGGEAPAAFLQRLGVRMVTKEVPLPAAAARAG